MLYSFIYTISEILIKEMVQIYVDVNEPFSSAK